MDTDSNVMAINSRFFRGQSLPRPGVRVSLEDSYIRVSKHMAGDFPRQNDI